MYKSFWEEQANILLLACKYVCMFNPFETTSSVIGNLFNSFFSVGIPDYVKWVTKLKFPYPDKNGHLIFIIKNIWQYYELPVFKNVVDSIPLTKCPYFWLYCCFSKDEFYFLTNKSKEGYFKEEVCKILLENKQRTEEYRICNYYKKDFKHEPIGSDVTNIYY